MALSIIVGPEQPRGSGPRNIPTPPPTATAPPVVCPTRFADPFDQRILDYARERVGFAVKSWTMVNAITNSLKPSSEAERRRIVKALLQRLKSLLHSRVVRRAGRYHVFLHVEGQPAPLSPFTRNIPRRRRRVRRKQVLRQGAASLATAHLPTSASASPSQASQLSNSASAQSFTASPPANTAINELSKTKSAQAPGLEVQAGPTLERPAAKGAGLAAGIKQRIASFQAGAKLARHRQQAPKKWTGYVHRQRCWRGRRVFVAGVIGGELLLARRGVVYVFADEPVTITGGQYWKLKEHQVVLSKLPEAVLLGAQKRGKKERPSERKAEACRRNGACPVRPGSRPRGRPRTAASGGR